MRNFPDDVLEKIEFSVVKRQRTDNDDGGLMESHDAMLITAPRMNIDIASVTCVYASFGQSSFLYFSLIQTAGQ
jgi:hypothetical protein